jgi:hypothetical protein
MGMTFKEKAGFFFDATGFSVITLVLYLAMASALPLSGEGENVLVYVSNYYLPLKRGIPALVFLSVWPVLFAGAWLRRWAPGLPSGEVRNYLAATLLLLWAGPLRDLFPGGTNWLNWDRMPHAFTVLVLALPAMFVFFRILAVADGDGPPFETSEFVKAVGFWFFGWGLFYSTFAVLGMRRILDPGGATRPFILAGIAMAYWSFLLGVRARRLAGNETRGWFAWGTILAGLWVLCVAAVWAMMRFLT